ncbi:MAG: hypothetical protein UY07_C0014G0014 [Parcubacteria group bacterium GW2011_GWA1_47_8]|nr:MAG: hypothetical protein UY07_C0014G0014 [Parcubacteria group bacterium GW2011_GWA1_47_8]
MKFGKVLLLSLSLIIPSVSSAIPPLEARIAKAEESFGQVLKNTPQKEVHVAVFFTNDMSLEDVRTALGKSSLAIKGFRHGTQSYSGGYSLKQGETLDEAIVNYRRDHLSFLQKRMEIEDKMLVTEANDDLRTAITSHRKEADQMKTDFEKNGIRVIGVEVQGRARDIQDLKEKNSFVRVIELKEHAKPQPAIVPNQ